MIDCLLFIVHFYIPFYAAFISVMAFDDISPSILRLSGNLMMYTSNLNRFFLIFLVLCLWYCVVIISFFITISFIIHWACILKKYCFFKILYFSFSRLLFLSSLRWIQKRVSKVVKTSILCFEKQQSQIGTTLNNIEFGFTLEGICI